LLSELDEAEEIYSAMLHSHTGIIEKLIHLSDDRSSFLRNQYETEKRRILRTYSKDMADYKSKKFQLQKELESVYYGLAEKTLNMTKTVEEEFMQRQDELKNSVSRLQSCNSLLCFSVDWKLKYNSIAIPIGTVHFSTLGQACN